LSSRIHFYNIQDASNSIKSICKIINKYYKEGYKVAVISDNDDIIVSLDKDLWTFEQISFVPHCTINNLEPDCNVILISKNHVDEKTYLRDFDVIMNLSDDLCDFKYENKIYLEIVTSNDKQKERAREKYKYYKDLQIKLDYESM
tara:strand:+ start:2734 stop:3168 length:435 start_codon:yes stop_codon:yes gene_type:complete